MTVISAVHFAEPRILQNGSETTKSEETCLKIALYIRCWNREETN